MVIDGLQFLPWLILYISQRFHLLWEEKEMMTGQDAVVHLHLFQSWVLIRRDDQVDAILEILMDDLNRCSLPIKNKIESVSTPLFGVQAHTVSCSYLLTSNSYGFW